MARVAIILEARFLKQLIKTSERYGFTNDQLIDWLAYHYALVSLSTTSPSHMRSPQLLSKMDGLLNAREIDSYFFTMNQIFNILKGDFSLSIPDETSIMLTLNPDKEV